MSAHPFLFASSRGSKLAATDLPAVRQTSERFRLLLENSVDVVVEATREGKILYVTSNVSQVFGYSVPELMHASIFAHVHPEDLAQVQGLFALPEGRGTCRYRHKNGSWRWIETTGREFRSIDDQLRSVLIVRDVTDRKESELVRQHLENELNKNAKLSAFGLLAGGIAHDFNNLLTVISVHLGLAQSESRNARISSSLSQAEQAIGQAKQLAKQILQYSRQQDTAHQFVRLPELVAEVVQLLRPTWPVEMELITHLPPHTGWIMANTVQLHQVVTNLLVNAAQAMQSGSRRLEVRVDTVVIDQAYADPQTALARGRYVQLTVRDTGHGMDAATQERIFDPFFTTKGEGTGLGLTVVQRIVKDHGACIRVSSEPGCGTTFRLFFIAMPSPVANPRID